MAATGWLNLVEGSLAVPPHPTCHDSTYDDFVVSRSLAHAVLGASRILDVDPAPHYPTRLFVRARPRVVLVRQLRRPLPFDAALPFGPPPAPVPSQARAESIALPPVSGVDDHAEYNRWVVEAERQLSAISGHDLEATARHAGRANGPSFVWRSACGPLGGSVCLLSHAARAWALTGRWLRRATLVQRDSREWERLYARVRHVTHEWGPVVSEEDTTRRTQFVNWRSGITRAAFSSRPFVLALADAAGRNADDFTRRSKALASKAWASWLHDGPAAGLRRQHRMSRIATGWVPAPVGDARPPPPLSRLQLQIKT